MTFRTVCPTTFEGLRKVELASSIIASIRFMILFLSEFAAFRICVGKKKKNTFKSLQRKVLL